VDEFWQRPDPALAAAGVEGEWLVARVRLFAVTLLLITPTYKLIQYPQIPVFVWGFWVTFCAALAALGIWLALRRRFWRPWLGFASSTLDVSLVTFALVTFVFVGSPLVALNSKVTFEIYFLAIIATSLRYDERICVGVGLLAVAQYAALWVFAALRYDLNDPVYAQGLGEYSVVDQTTRLILLTAAVMLSYAIVRRAQRLLHLAARDRLTGVYNRGQFDLVLVEVAARLARGMRATDMIARYGGEEFAILFPETGRAAAAVRVETLRAHIAAFPMLTPEGEELRITCSAGIAELPLDGLDAGTLLARADRRLLAAKRAGRDRLHSDDEEQICRSGFSPTATTESG
jgi:two-component system, cell cycle response regulator